MKRIAILTALAAHLGLVGARQTERRPLDLPAGIGGVEAEEDEPESIEFYGLHFEGDAFVWFLDRSGSMAFPYEKWNTQAAEFSDAVNGLSSAAEFGAVLFSSNIIEWRQTPARAVPANKAAAVAWIQSHQPDGATYIAPAGVSALDLANACRSHRVVVIGISDGVSLDAEIAVGDITSANYLRHTINTILLGDPTGLPLMTAIAESNGGSCRFLE